MKSTSGDIVRDPRGHGRETVESIVVAFTLALLFRAFEAEAFVIPTGSMAPTLMGRHKDLVCESCGIDYRVGASAEEDDDSQRTRGELARLEADGRDLARIAQLRRKLGGKLVPQGRCPNCGHVMPLTVGADALVAYDPRFPSFNGDRILVDKFAYDFAEPSRWDVVVFKYPEDAKTNYIKRLVGLPDETVFITAGDIWTSRAEDRSRSAARIARKPPDKLRAMLQLVHDASHVAPELVRAGWPSAWTDWGLAGPHWSTADDGRSFTVACRGGESALLRWRHMLPPPDIWQALEAGRPVASRAEAALVGDLQPYNVHSRGPNWVGDLAVELDLENRGDAGSVTLDLVKAGVPHRCTIDLADGRATLSREAADGTLRATGPTRVSGRGRWRLLFANVDDEVSLFVDGRPVAFEGPTTWTRSLEDAIAAAPVLRGGAPGDTEPDDLAPAGITADGADVRVSGMRLLRDVYYIASGSAEVMAGRAPEESLLAFSLGPRQFFMLGDNSSASKDSRAWGTPHQPLHSVERHLLIGRALVIFWPHGIPAKWSIPVRFMGQEVRLPFWPNFGRMGFVR
jgi:signal peptidase I